MRLSKIPIVFVRDQVARLAAAFGGKPAGEQAAFAVELQRATAGWTPDELFGAVTSALQGSDHFPRIRAIKLHRAARITPQQEQGSFDVCNRCGRHLYYAGYELFDGSVHPKVRCDCPSDNPAWNTAAARAWRETDPALIAAGFGTPPRREEYAT